MTDLLIGVDVGTTGTKAAVYDSTGLQLAEASLATPLTWEGHDRCYGDPDDFYRAALGSIRRCVDSDSVDGRDVRAIGIAGQMGGVMGVDDDFRPSMPYDSWLDSRCSHDVSELNLIVGDELTERTGCPPMVNHAPKMRWWKRERPEAYRNTAKFIMPGSYVAGRLAGLRGGDAFIDHTYLHFTGVADARAGCWSGTLTSAIGIDGNKLPGIVTPTTKIGRLTEEAARATHLQEDVEVAAGLGDTAAGALGAGIVRESQILDVAGTAAVFAGSTADFKPDTEHRTLLVMRGAVEGQWISLAYLSGGDLLSWFGASITQETSQDKNVDLEALIQGLETGRAVASDLLFLPFLDGRILPSNPSMRGAWLGLKRSHAREDMLRAVLESVPFEYTNYMAILQQLHPHMVPTEIRVAGGGGRSALWDEIKASVLGLPYLRLNRNELGCWGAALVAGKAIGLFDDLAATAEQTAQIAERIEPNSTDHERYRRLVPIYRASLSALEAPFQSLSELSTTLPPEEGEWAKDPKLQEGPGSRGSMPTKGGEPNA